MAQATSLPPTVQSGAIGQQNQRIQQDYQEQRGQRKVQPGGKVIIKPERAEQPAKGNAKISFVLNKIEFNKSHFLSDEQLQAIVAPYVGKRVTFATLQDIIDAVNALYKSQKIVTARAVLPPQAIHDGVVHITLVEGRVGEVAIRGNRYTGDHFIRSRVSARPGQWVDSHALQRELVFFNRTTDMHLQALLKPGTSAGLTDIDLLAQEPPRMSGDVFVDNAGVDSTGRERLGATFAFNGLFGIGDQFNAYAAHSRGDTDGTISYRVPVNTRNGRLGFSYSRGSINIIDGPFSQLDITGDTTTATLQMTQPLVATQNWLVGINGGLSRIASSTDVSGVEISNSKINELSLGFGATWFGPHHRVSTSGVISQARTNQALDGRNDFHIFTGSISGLGQFAKNWAYQLSLNGQWASSDTLPGSLLFQIGGLGSVRGYQSGTLAGPRGYVASVALHRYFGRKWDVYGFFDHGTVFAASPGSDSINGTGLGVFWQPLQSIDVSLDVARALDTVTSYQTGTRVDFRVNWHWDRD